MDRFRRIHELFGRLKAADRPVPTRRLLRELECSRHTLHRAIEAMAGVRSEMAELRERERHLCERLNAEMGESAGVRYEQWRVKREREVRRATDWARLAAEFGIPDEEIQKYTYEKADWGFRIYEMFGERGDEPPLPTREGMGERRESGARHWEGYNRRRTNSLRSP